MINVEDMEERKSLPVGISCLLSIASTVDCVGLIGRQFCAAILTKFRCRRVIGAQAIRTSACCRSRCTGAARSIFRSNDAGRYGQRPPADQHHYRSDKSADISLRRNIAKSNGSHSGDGPVHRCRHAGKTILRTFHHIHQRAHDNDHHQHKRNERGNLAPTVHQRIAEIAELLNISSQLKYPENTQHAQHAYYDQHLQSRK